MQKELQLLGLSTSEAKVYEALVHLGPVKAGAVIARVDVHRNIVYRALDTLVANGYVSRVERNGVWHFSITDPQSFMVSTKRRELVLGELVQQIQEVHERVSSQIVVYDGVASYRNYWLESIKRFPSGTVDHIAGGELGRWSVLMGKHRKEYVREAVRKGLVWKSLYLKPLTDEEREDLESTPVKSECRVWEPGDQSFFGNFNVIHDTVILHTPSENPRIIEMRDKTLVVMFRKMFDLMWDKAAPVALETSKAV